MIRYCHYLALCEPTKKEGDMGNHDQSDHDIARWEGDGGSGTSEPADPGPSQPGSDDSQDNRMADEGCPNDPNE